MPLSCSFLVPWDRLYPYICASLAFPYGEALHLRGTHQLAQLILQGDSFTYEGVGCQGVLLARWSLPRKNSLNHIPFLPYMGKDNITIRGGCPLCIDQRHKGLCQHSDEERIFETVITTRELAYAVSQLGYHCHEILEAYIYVKEGHLFAPFIKILSSLKIRHQKVPEAYQDHLEEYCSMINQQMQFTHEAEILKPELLSENKALVAQYKLNLNSSLGTVVS